MREYRKEGPGGARKNPAPGDTDEHYLPHRFSRFREAGDLESVVSRMFNQYRKPSAQ